MTTPEQALEMARVALDYYKDAELVDPNFHSYERFETVDNGEVARIALAAIANVTPQSDVTCTPVVDDVDFYRGVIAALGALAPHSMHGDVFHDEIVKSVGKERLYAVAEHEDVEWAGLDAKFYAATQAKEPK